MPDAASRECYRRLVPAPRRYVTDGIVLSRFDLGEADRVLTLITPELGKIKAILAANGYTMADVIKLMRSNLS